MAALSSPTRLALLGQLRTPRVLAEIEVHTQEGDEGKDRNVGSGRPISRQAVREHLKKLQEVGVVSEREAVRDRGATVEYLLNHQALFAIAEEFRSLARMQPKDEPEGPTLTGSSPRPEQPKPAPTQVGGPCLLLVKGLDEGRRFDLFPVEGASWVIGRKREAAVSLDFDPFLSGENTEVRWHDGAYWVVDLPGSRNGTMLNFHRLAKGAEHRLENGDIIGAGRCLLVYRG